MMVDNPLAIALFESFKNWGSKDPKFRKTYKKLAEPSFDIIISAFDELNIHTPGQYDWWWTKEHMRWIKNVSNQQSRYVHELMYQFLTKYARGQLKNDSNSSKKKSRQRPRQTETRAVI